MIFEKQYNSLSKSDQRAVKFGGAAVFLILVFGGLNILLDGYSESRSSLEKARERFESVVPAENGSLTSKQAGLFNVVPKFERPEKEAIAGEKFLKKFMEQVKKARIKNPMLDSLPIMNKKNSAGYRILKIRCKGKCSFDQSLDLLASLYDNPWYVGVEEFKIECNDPKKRKEMDLTIVVSTFVK